MNKEIKNKYPKTNWTPPGWQKDEWQIIWQKLWSLSKNELKNLAEKLGTHFTDENIQNKKAIKEDFILLFDDGVDKKELLKGLDKILKNKKRAH